MTQIKWKAEEWYLQATPSNFLAYIFCLRQIGSSFTRSMYMDQLRSKVSRLWKWPCALLFGFTCSAANAHYPHEIVVLGDSLSDSGNSRPADESLLGVPNLFSPATNGTTWPVLLAQDLGAARLNPSTQGGTNFAYVGALTSGYLAVFPNPTLTQQAQSLPSTINKNSPIFIWGGANDLIFEFMDPSIGEEGAMDISNILDYLHGQNYKTFIVLNLPDLGKSPGLALISPLLTADSLAFNSTLQQELAQKNYPVIAIDLYSLFEQVIADPQAFGLNNSTSKPDPTAGSGTNTSGYVFWYDGVHPTEASHELLSDYVFSILSAAECYATLAEIPFGVLREQRTNIHQQMAPMQPDHEKYLVYPFISGNYSPLLLPALSDRCEDHNVSGGDICVGFTDRVGDAWTVGIAGTYSRNSSTCHEGGNKCRFDLNAGILSIFGSFDRKHGYVNGIFNIGWLGYESIKRRFAIGPYISHTGGKTHGIDYDAELYGAYYIWSYATLRTGPLVEFNYQRVLIKGYTESGAAFGNISYRGQGNTLLSSGLGWEARLDYTVGTTELVTDLFLTANRQWLEQKRRIHFNEASLPGTHGAWPISKNANTFASAGFNLSALFSNRLIGSFGYTFNMGNHNMSEQLLTASLTMPIGTKKEVTATGGKS